MEIFPSSRAFYKAMSRRRHTPPSIAANVWASEEISIKGEARKFCVYCFLYRRRRPHSLPHPAQIGIYIHSPQLFPSAHH